MKISKSSPQTTKRHTIKKLAAAGSIATISSQSQWLKPMVQSTILPVHAESTPTNSSTTTTTTTTTGPDGPLDFCEVCGDIPTGLFMGGTNVSSEAPDPFMATDQGRLDLTLLNTARLCFIEGTLTIEYLGCSVTINMPLSLSSPVIATYANFPTTYPDTYPTSSSANYDYLPQLSPCLNQIGAIEIPQMAGIPDAQFILNTARGTTTIQQVASNIILIDFQIECNGILLQANNTPFTHGGGNITLAYAIQTWEGNRPPFSNTAEFVEVIGNPC